MWFISEASSEDKDALSECEPPHDKTNKIAFVPSAGSDQPVHPSSLIRVFAVRSMGSWGSNVSSRGQRRLIRLGGCTGWSVSSLGARAILLVLSCGSSCIPCSWVPSIKGESNCGSRSRWFDSGPATYRLLKLIMRIFSLIEKAVVRCLTYLPRKSVITDVLWLKYTVATTKDEKPQNRSNSNLSLPIQ